MANRYKPNLAKIETLDDANRALGEIGRLERELEQIDAEAQAAIMKIKSEATKRGKAGRDLILELTSQLGAYAEYNKAELFKERKSIELTMGIFGYRKSTAIHIKKTTVELLRKLNLARYIRVKEEADKEAMAELDDEVLAQVDAARKVRDEFFCAPAREEPNKESLRASA